MGLQDHVDRGLKVSDDFGKAELGALRHHEKRQPVHRLAGRMGVQGGERPRMPGVDRIKEGRGFGSAQFAKDDPVRPQAKRGLKELCG